PLQQRMPSFKSVAACFERKIVEEDFHQPGLEFEFDKILHWVGEGEVGISFGAEFEDHRYGDRPAGWENSNPAFVGLHPTAFLTFIETHEDVTYRLRVSMYSYGNKIALNF